MSNLSAAPLLAKLRIRNPLVRQFFAEFLGTLVLIVIGDGSVAQMVVTDNKLASYLSVNFGFAMAIAFGVYVSGGVSGGHINPAVTLVMAVIGRLKWIQVPVYMLGQYLGAFFGAAIVFGVYGDLIGVVGQGKLLVADNGTATATAGIFATYPYTGVSTGTLLFDQVVGTAMLLLFVMALTDKKNSGPHGGLTPLLVGLAVLAIGLSLGVNAGYAINPARDFGPRFFTFIAGYGGATFSSAGGYFWIPIVGPHLGAFIGVLVYLLLIENHWPDYEVADADADADLPEETKKGGDDETKMSLTEP